MSEAAAAVGLEVRGEVTPPLLSGGEFCGGHDSTFRGSRAGGSPPPTGDLPQPYPGATARRCTRRPPTSSRDRCSMHPGARPAPTDGRLGRLGAWAADHRRAIVIAWCAVLLVLGALAPFADRALSGAGWEASGSESVAARRALEARFPGRGTYALQVVVAGARRPVDPRCGARSRASTRCSAATPPWRACRATAGHARSRARRSSSAWPARRRARWSRRPAG